MPITAAGDDIPTTWHDRDSAREQTKSGLPVNDELLDTILEIAAQQVIEYGPLTLEATDPVPANYRHAQLMQAKNIWSAVIVDSGSGDQGDGTFRIAPFPLDWMVRQIIRPKRAVPAVY